MTPHDTQPRPATQPLNQRSREGFAQLHDDRLHDADRLAVRADLVALHLPLVHHLARRFGNRGETVEDLVQVGTIGLIKAIDGFDPGRGVEFSTYAAPTILGELKRWFRDKGWSIRMPRRLQELRQALLSASADLGQALGRSPTVAELAARIGVSEEQVVEGLESANAYSTVSLDAPDFLRAEQAHAAVALATADESLERVELRESLRPGLDRLPARDRAIVELRFFGQLTQAQIADEVGVSQMHVSRLLRRSLVALRVGLDEA